VVKDKTPKRGCSAGNPPSIILIDGVPVEGVEEYIYLGSKQSSNGYCRPDVLMSDQLQGDSVLQSMPLMLHWV